MDRILKQVIIACIAFLLLGGASFGIYELVRTKPTCTDGIQNQGEQDIDCGPVCGTLCAAPILPLHVEPATLLEQGDGNYDVVARVANPNVTYGASTVAYDIVLRDAVGGELSRQAGTFFIGPSQDLFVVRNLSGIAGPVADAELVVTSAQWQKVNLTDSPPVEFSLRRESYTTPGGGGIASRYEGVLFNDSDFDFARVDVAVILFDDAGSIVAVNRTNINTFLSRTERYFSVSWPLLIRGSVANVRVQASTNLFENENFIKRYGTQEEFQKYYSQ